MPLGNGCKFTLKKTRKHFFSPPVVHHALYDHPVENLRPAEEGEPREEPQSAANVSNHVDHRRGSSVSDLNKGKNKSFYVWEMCGKVFEFSFKGQSHLPIILRK